MILPNKTILFVCLVLYLIMRIIFPSVVQHIEPQSYKDKTQYMNFDDLSDDHLNPRATNKFVVTYNVKQNETLRIRCRWKMSIDSLYPDFDTMNPQNCHVANRNPKIITNFYEKNLYIMSIFYPDEFASNITNLRNISRIIDVEKYQFGYLTYTETYNYSGSSIYMYIKSGKIEHISGNPNTFIDFEHQYISFNKALGVSFFALCYIVSYFMFWGVIIWSHFVILLNIYLNVCVLSCRKN